MGKTELRPEAQYQLLNLRERLGESESADTSRGSVSGEELRRVFGAPWRSIELVRQLAGTSSETRDLSDCDALLFVVSGEGRAQFTSGPLDLRPGTSVAILKGEEYSVTAGGDRDLEFFYAEMEVGG